jgi:hypothetical protein
VHNITSVIQRCSQGFPVVVGGLPLSADEAFALRILAVSDSRSQSLVQHEAADPLLLPHEMVSDAGSDWSRRPTSSSVTAASHYGCCGTTRTCRVQASRSTGCYDAYGYCNDVDSSNMSKRASRSRLINSGYCSFYVCNCSDSRKKKIKARRSK